MAIFAIIALGVGFFAGLKVTKEGMTATVKDYLDRHAFFDYRLLSTLGFQQEEVDFLALAPDVEAAEGALSFDVLYRLEDGGQGAVRTHSVTEKLNTLKLVAGRMPENGTECVADSNLFGQSAIGSVICLSEDNEEEDLEHFAYREYTIVGIVRSPLYLQFERGNTSLGTGKLDGYLYLSPEGYDADYFTEVYVRFSQDYDLYSREYDAFLQGKDAAWEELGETAANRRHERILADAREELAEAEAEFQDKKAEGEAELADAAQTLAEAQAELAEGEQALEDARKEFADGEKVLREKEAELADARRKVAQSEEELVEGERALAEKEWELVEGERTLDAGIGEWNEGNRELEKAKGELEAQRAQLEAQAVQLAQGKEALTAGAEESARGILSQLPSDLPEEQALAAAGLAAGLRAIAGGELSLEDYMARLEALPEEGNAALTALKAGLGAAAGEISEKYLQLAQGEQTLEGYRAELARGEETLRQSERELELAGQRIREAQEELAQGRSALEDAGRELARGRTELENAKKELEDGNRALEDGRKELAEAEAAILEAETELGDGKREYEEGRQEYQDALKEFEDKIAEGEAELADARREIADIKEPDVYLLDRDTNVGYACFESDSNIVEGIANLFPVFFFLVAALVCITTMNRMVEEQRTQIGVLKALGYGNASIMFKFLTYSGLAALGGCVFGFFLGTWGFPKVIWLCYGIMYNADPIFYVFNERLAVISVAVSLLCSIGTTWLSCRVELSQAAAGLMRPKAPKAGRRVLLERVPFLWRRLSFLQKVTVRNIFRYKKRLFMMVLGISGCTALLVTGFGIKDSIADVAEKQFEEIQIYDVGVSLKEAADQKLREELEGLLASQGGEYVCVMEKNMDFVADGGVKPVWLVAGLPDELPSFVDFHTSKGAAIAYPREGEAVISSKLAEDYRVKEGDVIVLRDQDMDTVSFTVSGIYENFLYHYVHISEDTWRSITGEEPERKTVYINLGEKGVEESGISAHGLAAELMKLGQVSNVTVNADTMNRISTMMASLNIIVAVVILCAAGLAFIVLYNLTNINITERIREIATVKVLGFYKKETAAYVFRENVLLTLLGTAVGLVLGHFLHRVVLNEIRVDLIAFDVSVRAVSYVYSGVLTFVFAWIVHKTMGGKLEGISMTESLKSVD